jgi:hypothetical protein
MRELPSEKKATVSKKLRTLLDEATPKKTKALEARREIPVLEDVEESHEHIDPDTKTEERVEEINAEETRPTTPRRQKMESTRRKRTKSEERTRDRQEEASETLLEESSTTPTGSIGVTESFSESPGTNVPISSFSEEIEPEKYPQKDSAGRFEGHLSFESTQDDMITEHPVTAQEGVSVETESMTPAEQDKVAEQVVAGLSQVYQTYVQSLPTFAKLQLPSSTSTTPSLSFPENAKQLETSPDFQTTASKNQYELALQEEEAWEKLATGSDESLEKAEDAFYDIQERSQVIADSYKRRNEFPTAKTYEDAKTIIRAMGVPCLESEAPYEAEGLASAIVLAGHADFVASDDSVSC